MNRICRLSTLVALAGLMLGTAPTARAAFMTGTQAFADLGAPTIGNASSLATATTFNISMLYATAGNSGGFTSPSFAGTNFGASSFNTASPTSFSFGNAQFGMFNALSFTENAAANPSQARSFLIQGTFTSGTAYGVATTNTASFQFSFNVNGTTGSGMSYSDSGVLLVPAIGTVPEPASVAMLGLGLVGLAGYSARRRMSK